MDKYVTAVGGLGLFLLGIHHLTEGLKGLAGDSLRRTSDVRRDPQPLRQSRKDRIVDSPRPELLMFTVYLRPLMPQCGDQITSTQASQTLGFFMPGEGVYNMPLQFQRRHRQECRHDCQDDQDDLLGRRRPPDKAVEFTHVGRALSSYSARGGPLSVNMWR